jgi:hypothetical protein
MKSTNLKPAEQFNMQELSSIELQKLNGGGFAYDFGFALRELVIGTINGGGLSGAIAVARDLGENYRPAN